MQGTHPLLHQTYPIITSPWPGLWQAQTHYGIPYINASLLFLSIDSIPNVYNLPFSILVSTIHRVGAGPLGLLTPWSNRLDQLHLLFRGFLDSRGKTRNIAFIPEIHTYVDTFLVYNTL